MKIDRKAESPEKELVVKINCNTHVTQKSTKQWTPPPAQMQYAVEGKRAHIITSTNMVDTRWSELQLTRFNWKGILLIS